jgi:hypothetical protein
MCPGGFALPGVKVRLEAGVEHRRTDRNIVAMIPPGPEGSGSGYSQARTTII